MSKKEFFWGAIVVVAGLVLYQFIAPTLNGLLSRFGIGLNQPSA